jgi:hypothetical protein
MKIAEKDNENNKSEGGTNISGFLSGMFTKK